MSDEPMIHLSPPDLRGGEREAVLAALDSGWVAPVGPDLDAFEREVAAACGTGQAAALSSGTAALHLALVTAGVGPGDDVLVATLTFVASANAVVHAGARPVFVDAERQEAVRQDRQTSTRPRVDELEAGDPLARRPGRSRRGGRPGRADSVVRAQRVAVVREFGTAYEAHRQLITDGSQDLT